MTTPTLENGPALSQTGIQRDPQKDPFPLMVPCGAEVEFTFDADLQVRAARVVQRSRHRELTRPEAIESLEPPDDFDDSEMCSYTAGEIRRALRAFKGPDWRPIAEAIQDGRSYLLLFPNGLQMVGRWHSPRAGIFQHWCADRAMPVDPTHYAELDPSPSCASQPS